MNLAIDMTGKQFSQLTAIRIVGKKNNGNLVWLFKCDCGNDKEADGYDVRSGKIISCNKCGSERTRLASITHGMSNSPEFSTWVDIQSRCYNKNLIHYNNYGGRGIRVCRRWLESFDNFYTDMGKRPSKSHSIERINNDGDYSPDNCKWATLAEQANNKRTSCYITIDGITKTMAEWSKFSGVSIATIFTRKKAGYSGNELIDLKPIGSLTLKGETRTQKEWSEITGIKKSTISMRVKKNWPVEKVLTKGAKL